MNDEEWNALEMPDLSEAISKAIDMDRFAGTILLGLVREKRRLPGSYGLATDGVHLFVDPEMFVKLKEEEVPTGLIHEALHVGCLHMLRMKDLPLNKRVLAADFAVNELMHAEGFSLPEHSIVDTHKCWTQMDRPKETLQKEHRLLTMEEYYGELPTPPEMPGCGGCLVDPEEGLAQEIIERVQQAIQASKDYGNLAGKIQKEVDLSVQGPPAWFGLVRRFARGVSRGMSWRSFSRKTLSQGIYLPGRRAPAHKTLMVWVDTSGSVPDADLQEHMEAIRAILLEEPPERLIVGQFDAAVQDKKEILRGAEWPRTKIFGRGGTDFRPPLAESGDFDAIILLTDGEGPFPEQIPRCPVLWVLTTDVKPPFGMIARAEKKKKG